MLTAVWQKCVGFTDGGDCIMGMVFFFETSFERFVKFIQHQLFQYGVVILPLLMWSPAIRRSVPTISAGSLHELFLLSPLHGPPFIAAGYLKPVLILLKHLPCSASSLDGTIIMACVFY